MNMPTITNMSERDVAIALWALGLALGSRGLYPNRDSPVPRMIPYVEYPDADERSRHALPRIDISRTISAAREAAAAPRDELA